MTSLNPYMKVSEQMAEVLIHHKGLSKLMPLSNQLVCLMQFKYLKLEISSECIPMNFQEA